MFWVFVKEYNDLNKPLVIDEYRYLQFDVAISVIFRKRMMFEYSRELSCE